MFHRKRHHHNQQQQPPPQMPSSQQHLRSNSVGSRTAADSNTSVTVLDSPADGSIPSQTGRLTVMDDNIGLGSTSISSTSLKLIEGFRRRSTSPVCPKTVQLATAEALLLSSDHSPSPVRKHMSSPTSPARTNNSLAASPDTNSSSSSSSLTGLFRRKARSPIDLSATQSFSLPPPRPHPRNHHHHHVSTGHSTQLPASHHPTSPLLEHKGRSLSPLPSPSVGENLNQSSRPRKISNIQQPPPPLVVLNAMDHPTSSSWQPQSSFSTLIDSRQIRYLKKKKKKNEREREKGRKKRIPKSLNPRHSRILKTSRVSFQKVFKCQSLARLVK